MDARMIKFAMSLALLLLGQGQAEAILGDGSTPVSRVSQPPARPVAQNGAQPGVGRKVGVGPHGPAVNVPATAGFKSAATVAKPIVPQSRVPQSKEDADLERAIKASLADKSDHSESASETSEDAELALALALSADGVASSASAGGSGLPAQYQVPVLGKPVEVRVVNGPANVLKQGQVSGHGAHCPAYAMHFAHDFVAQDFNRARSGTDRTRLNTRLENWKRGGKALAWQHCERVEELRDGCNQILVMPTGRALNEFLSFRSVHDYEGVTAWFDHLHAGRRVAVVINTGVGEKYIAGNGAHWYCVGLELADGCITCTAYDSASADRAGTSRAQIELLARFAFSTNAEAFRTGALLMPEITSIRDVTRGAPSPEANDCETDNRRQLTTAQSLERYRALFNLAQAQTPQERKDRLVQALEVYGQPAGRMQVERLQPDALERGVEEIEVGDIRQIFRQCIDGQCSSRAATSIFIAGLMRYAGYDEAFIDQLGLRADGVEV